MRTFTISFILLLGLACRLGAQNSNLIVFAEQGERFYLILNGLRQNETAETNVKVTGLNAPSYKLKIIFEQPGLPEIDKTIYFPDPEIEVTYVINRNRKGELSLKFMNSVDVPYSPRPNPGQSVIQYHTQPLPPAGATTVTTQTTQTAPSQGNFNVSINDPDLGVNINMNVGGTQVQSSQTVTTTTTTTTTGGYTSMPPSPDPAPPAYVMPGYSGPVGCPYPMSPQQFQQVKNSISSKSFEDSKLTIAKQVIGANCLLTSQVKEIMELFSFESTKLELAKFAYGYTYDIGNYYQLNDAFDFESSIDDLNDYIRRRN